MWNSALSVMAQQQRSSSSHRRFDSSYDASDGGRFLEVWDAEFMGLPMDLYQKHMALPVQHIVAAPSYATNTRLW